MGNLILCFVLKDFLGKTCWTHFLNIITYKLPADVIKLVLRVAQGDLGVGQLLVKVVDGLLIG